MSEMAKTGIYAGAAVLFLVLAGVTVWSYTPSTEGFVEKLNTEIFPKLEDPFAVASLEIVKYDESTNEQRQFMVAQKDGVWSIPSHSDYPTDAKDQLAAAATSLMGLKKLAVATNDRSAHKLYGVVDPEKAEAGDTGVGMRVTLADENNKVLARLIIGNSDPEKEELRYVRLAGQDRVYVTNIDTGKLSTRFEDWINQDLLELQTTEILNVIINDHSVDEQAGRVNQGEVLKLVYDDDAEFNKRWSLESGLAENEELDTQKLNDMTSSFDDLKIVDVVRKPEGIGAQLQSEEDLRLDPLQVQYLAAHGFYPARTAEGKVQLYSNEGELRIQMNDGVEYVLRFGAVAADTEDDAAEAAGDDAAEDSASGANRYLLIAALFNQDLIEKPKLQPLPGQQAAGPQPEGDGPRPQGGFTPQDFHKIKAEGLPAPAALEAERKRIEEANALAQEEYDGKVEAGRKHADQLNRRFAKWYYVISDKVYNELHLGRSDFVKAKEAEEADDGDGNGGKQGAAGTP